jgi:hypothetical protein
MTFYSHHTGLIAKSDKALRVSVEKVHFVLSIEQERHQLWRI